MFELIVNFVREEPGVAAYVLVIMYFIYGVIATLIGWPLGGKKKCLS